MEEREGEEEGWGMGGKGRGEEKGEEGKRGGGGREGKEEVSISKLL